MKTRIKALLLLPVLTVGLGLMPAGRVTAQTFSTLYSFTGVSISDFSNSDGANPYAELILSGNRLYGTAVAGGGSANGTVFAVNTDGTGFTNLHSFTATSGPLATNNDGAFPDAGLILAGNSLYGTAPGGGSSGNGTVFKINTDGTGFTVLHHFTATPATSPFTNSDGAYPSSAALILSGNTLYGTAHYGGSSGNGTIFAVNTNGSGFTNVYVFTAGALPWPSITNSDGAFPYGGLILADKTLYGTAQLGGSSDHGTVFAVNTNGTGFTNLHNFTAPSGPASTNSDGAYPIVRLVLSGNVLYGVTASGGSSGHGTVFAVNTNGTGFTNLHSFTATSGAATNSDGASPNAGLILSGNTLFGTADSGGTSGNGTLFAINIDGTGFTNLHNFTATSGNSATNSDGANPEAGLILSGNTLYGTAYDGGSSGSGTLFRFLLSLPQLTIIPNGANVILMWPTNAVGFNLQFATNLASPAVWSAVSPGPVVIGDQKVVFDPVIGPRKFYRLSR